MGGSYVNVSVRGAGEALVRRVLERLSRNARLVADGPWTVVCDQQSDEYYESPEPLAEALSAGTDGPVVLTSSFDGDTLDLAVYTGGTVAALYRLAPGYPDDDLPPQGDAEAFVRLLAPDADVAAVRAAMFDRGDDDFAMETHERITAALGLPDKSVGTKWSYLEDDDIPYTEVVTTEAGDPPMLQLGRLLSQPGALATGVDGVVRPAPELEREMFRLIAGFDPEE